MFNTFSYRQRMWPSRAARRFSFFKNKFLLKGSGGAVALGRYRPAPNACSRISEDAAESGMIYFEPLRWKLFRWKPLRLKRVWRMLRNALRTLESRSIRASLFWRALESSNFWMWPEMLRMITSLRSLFRALQTALRRPNRSRIHQNNGLQFSNSAITWVDRG